jgi:heat shock protein beta
MKAQALSDDSRMNYMKGKKTLEINPRHPIIKEGRCRLTLSNPSSKRALFQRLKVGCGESLSNFASNINLRPYIKALRNKATEDPESEEVRSLATVMFETAMLESGFTFDEPAGFAGRLFNMVRNSMAGAYTRSR